jgi:hypothetical protein
MNGSGIYIYNALKDNRLKKLERILKQNENE